MAEKKKTGRKVGRPKKPPTKKKSAPTMTPEQQELFDKLTPLLKAMAIPLLHGKARTDAYREAKGPAADKMNPCTLRSAAFRAYNSPDLQAWLTAMNSEMVSQWIMSREEALERLTIIGRANLGDFVDFGEFLVGTGEDGKPVLQATWKLKDQAKVDPDLMAAVSELTAGRDGLKIKLHPALAALKQLSEMQGWDAPVKVQPLQPKTLDDFYNDVNQAEGSATADA